MSAPPSQHAGKSSLSGVVLIFVTLLGWSSVPLFLRYFTGYIDAWTANGWRYGMSALFWVPAMVWSASRGSLPKGVWKAALFPAMFNIAAQICFALAPYYILPGMLTFLLRLQIVFVAVGAYILFPAERLVLRSPTYIVGVVTVFGGLMGLCFLGETPPSGGTLVGIILGISAGLLYGAYSLAVRRCIHDIHPIHAFGAISLFTASGLIPLMLWQGKSLGAEVFQLSTQQFLMLIASAMAGIAITHVTYYAAIARLGVSLSAGVILLQPFICSAASYFLFDERLTLGQWLSGAGALVGAGVMLDTQRRLQRRLQRSDPIAFQEAELDAVAALRGGDPQPTRSGGG